jgi:hypothetical protein
MKKILVVLLVLAAATGVFAQEGEWSLGGNVEVGSFIDFSGDDILATGSTYNFPYDGWGPIQGTLGIGYTLDALKVGLTFSTSRDEIIWGDISYDAGNYALAAYSDLTKLVTGTGDEQRLWGYYKLLNEMVTLEAAYKGPDKFYWESDTTGALVKYTASVRDNHIYNGLPWSNPARIDQWTKGQAFTEQPWATTNTFSGTDKANYILANVNLSNLEFGIKLPDIIPSLDLGGGSSNLLEDTMKKAVVGLKFTMQPVEVAAQFQMGNYGVYFGGKWFIGPVTAGLSFSGILDPDAPSKVMRFGGGVEYNPGVFGAWIKAFYGTERLSSGDRGTQIGIEPGFFYNVIPSHLQFKTSVGFYFTGGKAGGVKQDLEVGWAVQPELFWNFLGTGAGTYWGYGTGMIVRYRLVADDDGFMGKTNALDVNFKFSF